MKKIIIGCLSVVALLMLFTACDNEDKKIQRTWIKAEAIQGNPKEEPVMIFSEGHQFEFRMSNVVYAKGHYHIDKNHHVTMKSDEKSMNARFNKLEGHFNKDLTKFTLKNGETFEPYKGDMGDDEE